MRNKDLLTVGAFGLSALGGAMLVYGALVESKRLVLERLSIPVKGLPDRLDGFRIAVLGDFHVGNKYSLETAQRAIDMALDQDPDMVCLVGDFVSYWKVESPWLLGDALESLLIMDGSVVAIPGNHDYRAGSPEILRIILDELNIKLLRNESWVHKGICWTGIDSFNEGHANAAKAFSNATDDPTIVLWHEPDLVDMLPTGQAILQLSGHSHGGQFRFPGNLTPMTSANGDRYRDGFYPDASTPLFVTRGVGTTGPPSRFLCPPQVAILTLEGV
ncbi:MAG: metallophosphoesterase [Armatimonadetes bacterium]|nr:metallophosphoesterase [Armatimonadota bacterium]